MTEEQARAICNELGATLAIKRRRNALYVYVQRWVPKSSLPAHWKGEGGQAFERYVCSLKKLSQLDEKTLRMRIAALPDNPNKLPEEGQYLARTHPHIALWHAQTDTPEARPTIPIDGTGRQKKTSRSAQAVNEIVATIPHERTGIITWATQAQQSLSIPREQLAYRLALYRDQLITQGVRFAQSTRHKTLFIPSMGIDEGAYYSHIWRE